MKSVLGTDLNPLPLKVGGAGEKSQGVTPQLMIYKYTSLHIQDGHCTSRMVTLHSPPIGKLLKDLELKRIE